MNPSFFSDRRLAPLLVLLLLVVTTLAYWPGLSGGFIFDDLSSIVGNSAIHLTTLDAAGLWNAAFSFAPGGGSRPLSMLSFAFNHVADGLNPWGYKLVSLGIHVINMLLIFALALRLLALGGIEGASRLWMACALALVWAIHPLQISSVLYVVQRMETLSLLFVLLALLSYLRGRENQMAGKSGWPWLAACVPLWALGWFGKESAALLPVYALAFELTVLGFRAQNPNIAKFWRMAYLVGSAAALVLFFFYYAPQHYTSNLIEGRNFSTPERLLTQLRALTLYLQQILLPLPNSMTFYYDDFAVSKGLFSPPSTAISAVVLLALLSSALWARTRFPLYALGVFIFFAAHAITSNILGLELVFEHRNYFALFGVVLAVGELVRHIPVRDGPAIKFMGVGALLAGLLALTLIRSATWGNALLLAEDLASKNPQAARALGHLASRYYDMSAGNPDSPAFSFAENLMQKAAVLPNASSVDITNVMRLRLARGAEIPDELWKKLYAMLENDPIGVGVEDDIFAILEDKEVFKSIEPKVIMRALNILLQRKPDQPAHRYAQLGDYALYHLGDAARAEVYFIEAIKRSEPHSPLPAQILNDLNQNNQQALAQSLKGVIGADKQHP